jgi:RNA polymerase sigma-70 factor, ECF subfamily
MAVDGPVGRTAFELRRLVQRAKADPECFGELYDLHVDGIYAFAFRRLGSRAEAEDVTADTMLAAMANLDRFTWKGGGFGAWLFRIARNRCLDVLRDRQREMPLLVDPAADSPSVEGTPEQALIDKEQHAEVRALVAGLPDPQQEIVLLKYVAGLSNTEIAGATGKTPTAVSSLLNRATVKLRKQWGEQHG